ncbi:MAG TPA: S8 family serine peptidase [Symbiobacteriaceae bacterium]|nr:S8 family serine peptidase [Symbiobacteriaceae bacterium]
MRIRSMFSRLLVAVMLLTVALPAYSGTTSAAPSDARTYRKEKLHPDLRRQVDQAADGAQFTVIIKGRDKARLDAIRFRSDDVVAALKSAAARSQNAIVSHLRARNAQVLTQFWITNAIVARVDRPTLESLTNLDQVDLVYDNFRVQAPPARRAAAMGGGALTWGLEKIQAARVWDEIGVNGQGIRVAVLDTGVDIAHPDLAGKMHSDNPGDPTYPGGWIEFDGNGQPVAGSVPHDTDAHGTHTSGTVLGGSASGTGIGVAPGATLMHAVVIPGGGGTFAQVVAGMQWTVEPTDSAGNPAGQRPHIASMSFGAEGLRSEVVEVVRNMYAAGVLPIAAIGNCGENCVGSPGAVYEAFAIGASADDDSIAGFSGGATIAKNGWDNPPENWPDQWVKPDISAPGVSVISAVPGGGYESWDGTSMATPHAAGTAALMLSANPNLTPDLVLATLQETSYWDNRYGEARPNPRYGYGRINAYEAVSRIAYNSGISGVVTDSATGAPLGQAVVAVEGSTRAAKTKDDGSFSLVLPAGTYNLKVSRFGYAPEVKPNITVTDGQYSQAAFALQPLPKGRVKGQVTYNLTGIGIPGVALKVAGVPIRLETETDADGAYAFDLPVGSYSLDVTGYGFGKATAADITVTESGQTTRDVALEALPRVAVIGDYDEALVKFLAARGYLAEQTWFSAADHIGDYSVVIVNAPGKAMPDEFTGLVSAAEQAGVGLIFTKSYGFGWGIDMLRDFYGDPVTTGFDWFPVPLTGKVAQPHPDLLPGRAEGERFELLPAFTDAAWFSGYSGTTLVSLHNDYQSPLGDGVAYKQNAGNRHVLLAGLGAGPWQGPAAWTDAARELFLNAVKWVARPDAGGAKFIPFALRATPDTVLWNQTVDLSVGVKNIGSATGTYDVMPAVNGEPAGIATFELAPGQHERAAFTVQREPVGSYQIQVGHLSAAFRVRPPKVSVSARTIYLPPSGKGRNADPGEPAIPLAGARVDVVRSGQIVGRGQLDASGNLTFDSTASRDDYTIVIHHPGYGYNISRSYLLTMPVHVEGDVSYGFAPQAADAARLGVALTTKSPSHHGSLFLSGGALGKAAYGFPAGALVVTPGQYQIATVMAYDVPGAQWAYASERHALNLAAGQQSYTFGGDLQLSMADVRGQQAPKAQVTWAMADGYGHTLAGIYQVTAGAFGPTSSRKVTDSTHWPATVAATAQQAVRPVLTLTNPLGAIEQTGPIGWAERPRPVSFETARVLPGDYSLLLQSDTGPYMGRLQAEAKLMLPARSASRTLVMPGDTFDVTVVFDAGSGGDLTLSESLPAGFRITRQSAQPNAAAFSGSTWTWRPSGKGAYRAGQAIRVTYTVQVDASVAAGIYSLTGVVNQNGAARAVAGPQSIQVVR